MVTSNLRALREGAGEKERGYEAKNKERGVGERDGRQAGSDARGEKNKSWREKKKKKKEM